jgi:hypothetical protein
MNTGTEAEITCSNCEKSFVVCKELEQELRACPFCENPLCETAQNDECSYLVQVLNGNGLEEVEAFNFDWMVGLLCEELGINHDELVFEISEKGNIHVYVKESDGVPLVKFDVCKGYVYADQDLVLKEKESEELRL